MSSVSVLTRREKFLELRWRANDHVAYPCAAANGSAVAELGVLRRLHPSPVNESIFMRFFFRLMLVLSLVSASYAWLGYIGFFAHNHYGQRFQLLDTTKPQPDSHIRDAVTSVELATADERFAYAYRVAVLDGTRLGAAFDRMTLQSLAVTGFLFISSLVGLHLSRRNAKYAATNA